MTTSTLPMFPLELVVFPGEQLALHIFEERYQQLITDCENHDIKFGIPTYFNNSIEYGTEVKLVEVVKRYPSGASDVICEGVRIFKVTRFYTSLINKLYAGGEVIYITKESNVNDTYKQVFLGLLREFYNELDVKTPIFQDEMVDSYSLSHKIGLTLEQEYELLKMNLEEQRYKFLIRHLEVTLPALKTINRAKEIIKLNGHFKNFDPLDFREYTS